MTKPEAVSTTNDRPAGGPPPMAKTTKALPINVIQQNIVEQLQTSRAIYVQVRALADIADHEQDATQKARLEEVMEQLLRIGENLANQAGTTGDRVLETTRLS